jgi:hypothetical protein
VYANILKLVAQEEKTKLNLETLRQEMHDVENRLRETSDNLVLANNHLLGSRKDFDTLKEYFLHLKIGKITNLSKVFRSLKSKRVIWKTRCLYKVNLQINS